MHPHQRVRGVHVARLHLDLVEAHVFLAGHQLERLVEETAMLARAKNGGQARRHEHGLDAFYIDRLSLKLSQERQKNCGFHISIERICSN
jgi:hypothetical protein